MRYFLVRAVPGRLTYDVVASEGGARRYVGHTAVEDGTRIGLKSVAPVPHFRYEWVDEETRVAETRDHYVRRKIKDGDLDYVSTIDVARDGTERESVDLELVAMTSQHRLARAAAKPASPNSALHADPVVAAHMQVALDAIATAKAAADTATKAQADAAKAAFLKAAAVAAESAWAAKSAPGQPAEPESAAPSDVA